MEKRSARTFDKYSILLFHGNRHICDLCMEKVLIYETCLTLALHYY